MEDDQGGGFRLSKKSSDKGGEVDYKTKAGTAWSHNFLNQKPWHPLSYPNQRRKWIAEQTHAQKERRAEEVAREYAQEQEFLRQTALISKKEKEKMEMMRAVSFMYVKPPGYNPESAKAAEVEDEKKKLEGVQEPSLDGPSSSAKVETVPSAVEKKKQPKDVFGRALPTEEQFEVLKNAPRLETGVAGRAKPFGVEIRNVKCLRCGNYGHQSGDRECPLKDAIMPNEESRLKRDDPLTAIQAQTDCSEPLKWELKQKPGMSPPRGGFNPDDPNQQIVAEDIFDEYGGFLGEANIPELLTNFSSIKTKKKSKSKHRRKCSPVSDEIRDDEGSGSSSGDDRRRKSKKRHKKKKRKHSESRSSESSDGDRHRTRRDRHRHRRPGSSEASDSDEPHRSRRHHRDRDHDRDRRHHRQHHRHHSSSD
ncbi:CBF1-interacting corepressor CIR [Handroanthus impetiginosus]|uniref:CBF1-interacting corepressor CIR n=1 Tax=Handroanthus impetiginosus TaxID=429701 RepID=A0A2G9H4W3_9LAMI|nr:CBF1-interacting corepressor CIR [Handroanthus impetiginosus]